MNTTHWTVHYLLGMLPAERLTTLSVVLKRPATCGTHYPQSNKKLRPPSTPTNRLAYTTEVQGNRVRTTPHNKHYLPRCNLHGQTTSTVTDYPQTYKDRIGLIPHQHGHNNPTVKPTRRNCTTLQCKTHQHRHRLSTKSTKVTATITPTVC